ncbi:nucleoplasmin-like protein ANO39 [Musca vetustissima]|uniref:nucleoplasmin-like protein ANO39 n=1 Tax=Musca vetustissima TaxID=27455 RepID=UPI002AB708F1|nr:nucleoplasmin-like protein ANO39 [Musca vetustissima]
MALILITRSSNQAARKAIRYNKVPTNNRRRNRITSSSTLLKVDAEANIDDEDIEDDEEEEATVEYYDEEEDEEEIYERDMQQCQTQTPILAEDDDGDDRQTKLSPQGSEEQELHTFVRVPLKKTPAGAAARHMPTSSEDKTQRT